MTHEIRTIIGSTLFILVFGILSHALLGFQSTRDSVEPDFAGSWACTTDIQICADGTTVGRVPPYCQFAICGN